MNRSVSMSFIPQTGVIDLRRNLHHGNSAVYGFSEPGSAHFLDACYLCKRRLGEGCDIYMYRGDTAFCSEECRQQQIGIDDRKEKAEAAAAAMNARGGVKKGQVAGNSKYRAHAGTVAAG